MSVLGMKLLPGKGKRTSHKPLTSYMWSLVWLPSEIVTYRWGIQKNRSENKQAQKGEPSKRETAEALGRRGSSGGGLARACGR